MLQFWLETDKAAYLLRQYFFNNLHDRLSTRPFLCVVEKKWLAFQVIFLFLLSNRCNYGFSSCKWSYHVLLLLQLLYAVKQSHEHGVCHGEMTHDMKYL